MSEKQDPKQTMQEARVALIDVISSLDGAIRKIQMEPQPDDEQAAIKAFEERWTAIISGEPVACGRKWTWCQVFPSWEVIALGGPANAEAAMRQWFKAHVATLSIDEMDKVWEERQGISKYPVTETRRDKHMCHGPYRVLIYLGKDMFGGCVGGYSDISPTDAFRKAHEEASYKWVEMQVTP